MPIFGLWFSIALIFWVSSQFLCHPQAIGANMKVRGVGDIATARASVETRAVSVTWFGGLCYITIPAYLPLVRGWGRGGREAVDVSGWEVGLAPHHKAMKPSPLALILQYSSALLEELEQAAWYSLTTFHLYTSTSSHNSLSCVNITSLMGASYSTTIPRYPFEKDASPHKQELCSECYTPFHVATLSCVSHGYLGFSAYLI